MRLSDLARAIAANLVAFANAQDAAVPGAASAPDIDGDPLAGMTAAAPAAGEPAKRGRGRPPKSETAAAPAAPPATTGQDTLDLGAPAGDGDPLAGMAPAPAAPPAAPTGPSESDLHVAVRELVKKHGPAAGAAIVKRVGVAQLKDIPAKHYAAVIKACQIETAKPVAK